MRKFFEFIKRFLPYIVGLAVFWLFIIGCWFLGRSLSDDTISASAEYVQPTDYASGNLIKSSDIYASGSYGQITWTVRDDGTILLNGTTDRTHTFPVFRKYSVPSFMTVGASYTFSSNELQLNRISVVHSRTVNGTTTGSGYTVNDVTFTLQANTTYIDFYYYISANQTFDNLVLKPMLNQGSVSYPFQPNYEYFYNQGEEFGYGEGRTDGLMKGNISFLYESTATVSYSIGNLPNNFKTSPTSVDGQRVSLTDLATLIGSSATGISLRVDLAEPTLGRDIFWVAEGNASAFYNGDSPKTFTAVMEDGSRYTARWYWEEDLKYYGFQIQGVENYDVYLSYIEGWYVGTLTDLKSIYFRAPDSSFSSGYDVGYNVGFEAGVNDNTFYQTGYDKGYDVGLSQGLSSVDSNVLLDSVKGFVFSLFDAPVNTFLSSLNLSYGGFDLGALVAFIFTAVVVIAVLKLVV